MRIRLSVRDGGGAAGWDVEVTADPESPVGSVLDALPVAVGGRSCYLGTRRLDPGAALTESGLRQGATLSVGSQGAAHAGRPANAAGAFRVFGGPDTGLIAWLPPGSHAVGRHPAAAVSLADVNASRSHARVEVSWTGEVTVTDLGSSNGTLVDGTAITGPVPLTPENVLRVGDDRLRWVPLPQVRLKTKRSRDGRLEFDRAFAPAPAVPRAQVSLPPPETDDGGAGGTLTRWISGLAPVGMGIVMAVTLRQPILLLIALLAPVTLLVPLIMERRQRRARERKFEEGKAEAEEAMARHIADEERLLRALAPDEMDVRLAGMGDTPWLWPRGADSPNGLVLRVGTTEQEASIDLQGQPWPGFEKPMLRDVPVTVDLRTIGVLGVAGPVTPVNALVRWLLVQLGTLRDPYELGLVIISSGDGEELSWASWLPHLDAGDDSAVPCRVGNTAETRAARVEELKATVAARRRARGQEVAARFGEEIVVLLDGALALRQVPGMKEILREGPSVGVYVICVDRSSMGDCHGLCDLQGTRLSLTRSRDGHPVPVRAEGISRGVAEHLARRVAPMRDRLSLSRHEAAIPSRTRFLDLLGIETPAADDVRARWEVSPGPTTRVPIGEDAEGPVFVDLDEQGPHAMLGGATGAGKSILLQTLVTSLLLANRPDELNLVLVDFKGGGAFLPFQHCPHVVALIRSTGDTPADVFDEAAAARVLASVRSEVNRRESLLAPYGGEIGGYWNAGKTLPRLVMIFDEFARVLEVSPDFLKELVNVSAKGRSLGMHLLLATQSLQGKLSAELKNNISLRISLRQNEPAESREVLEVPDAARIPGRCRGRGMILCTKDDSPTPQLVQSGYLGDPPPTGEVAPAQVRIAGWPSLGVPRPEEQVDHGDAATDQDLTIAAVIEAARRPSGGLPAPFRPVLAPLPAVLTPDELEQRATGHALPDAVPYGLADDPAGQAQPMAALHLAGTDRLLCAGGPQSGRTTFAGTLITTLAERFRPGQVHLYAIENQPAGLAGYEALPHCGGVFSPAEPDRIRRFVLWLDGEVRRRKNARFTPATEPSPWIVVVIDGWEYFEDRGDPMWEETSLLGTLRGVIAAGAPLGVHVVAIGGQAMLSGKLPDLYSHRLLLPFPQEETRRMYLSSGTVPPPTLPGRAIEAGSRQQVQVCVPELTPAESIARTTADPKGPPPRTFPSLPIRITYAELALPDPPPSPTWVAAGVGGQDTVTVGIDLFGSGTQTLLVSGPPGSGRSTAAATLAHGLRRAGIGVLALASPRSPLPGLLPDDAGVRVVTGVAFKDADLRDSAAAFGDGPYAVVVDDCEQLTVTAEEENWEQKPTLLEDLIAPAALGRRALIMCGDALPIIYGRRPSFRRVVDEIMSSGTRLLLTPTGNSVARDHGISLEPGQFFPGPPGRGYLTDGRAVELVHLALPAGELG